MTIILLYGMSVFAIAFVVVLVSRWAMRRADDQDHMPRSDEVPAAFAPRGDGG